MDKRNMSEQKLQNIETKVEENSERLDRVETKLDGLDAKVDENSERLNRVETKVDELDTKVEKNGKDINDLKTGQRRLEVGLQKQQRQIDDYFEFFKQQFEIQREESRRHVEVIIESFQSCLQAQGEGVRANRDGVEKNRVEHRAKEKAINAQLADHEIRLRKLEAGG